MLPAIVPSSDAGASREGSHKASRGLRITLFSTAFCSDCGAERVLGRRTLSTTCMTPLSQRISVDTTFALFTLTPSVPTLVQTQTVQESVYEESEKSVCYMHITEKHNGTEIFTSAPLTVLTSFPSRVTTVSASTFPETQWYVRIEESWGMSFNSASTVPAGSLANASSVGAKTVNGPALFNVGTRPAAVKAAASVLNEPALTAVSTMSAIILIPNLLGCLDDEEIRLKLRTVLTSAANVRYFMQDIISARFGISSGKLFTRQNLRCFLKIC